MPRVELISNVFREDTEVLRNRLRSQYGMYSVAITIDPNWEQGIFLRCENEISELDASDGDQLPDFITAYTRLAAKDLSCRSDAALLDDYRTEDGHLNIFKDPREWIETNPVIGALIQQDSSMRSVLDYVVERQGLFIKPPQFRLQGNYWNSSTNGGIPIVRKKDVVHEATFMLHDIFHCAIQDPLPFDVDNGPHSSVARLNFVFHRMASEATAMVLADMDAIHKLGLEDQGYDTSKRRIYPVYKSILESNPNVDVEEVIRANIEFCFTGKPDMLIQLGANTDVVQDFMGKYETFFSADFGWNDHNYIAVNNFIADNPSRATYYHEVRDMFGLPLLSSHPDGFSASEVSGHVMREIQKARSYKAHHDEVVRRREVARRYYAGQLALFYRDDVNTSAKQHLQYIEFCHSLLKSQTEAEMSEWVQIIDQLLDEIIDASRRQGTLDSQKQHLYKMHVPLYPAFFINYEQEKGAITSLKEAIAQLT